MGIEIAVVVLCTWLVVATFLALAIGRAVRMAESRERDERQMALRVPRARERDVARRVVRAS